MSSVLQSLPAKQSWWRRWLLTPILTQLKVGISPDRVAWTIALGAVLGVFPVMGTTTVLCAIVGGLLHLNQPILHVFRLLVYPLHLVLILVFIRLGERLYGVPLLTFSIPELIEKFEISPLNFIKEFGMAAWHGVTAWLLVAPVAIVLIKVAVLPALNRLALSLSKLQEENA
jgi:uncharacterized protein (DUF2062 family)